MKPEDQKRLKELEEKYPDHFRYIKNKHEIHVWQINSLGREEIEITRKSPEGLLETLTEIFADHEYRIDYVLLPRLIIYSEERRLVKSKNLIDQLTLQDMHKFDLEKKEDERIRLSRIKKHNDKTLREQKKKAAFLKMKAEFEPEKVLSEWIVLKNSCAVRAIKGTDPELNQNKVAFITDSILVRVAPDQEGKDDSSNWIRVGQGYNPFGSSDTRMKCDKVLRSMGYIFSEEL